MGKAKKLKKYLKSKIVFVKDRCASGCDYYSDGECQLFPGEFLVTRIRDNKRCDDCKKYFGE